MTNRYETKWREQRELDQFKAGLDAITKTDGFNRDILVSPDGFAILKMSMTVEGKGTLFSEPIREQLVTLKDYRKEP